LIHSVILKKRKGFNIGLSNDGRKKKKEGEGKERKEREKRKKLNM
jgi:hypothetical protein